ncbi:hypothetical protein FHS57_005789 [Runella defluvii]|uniref:Copper resistance protein NlpE n=1 Tax=Runella defluvii TaxID=370973 RepID=A0A7W5ZQF5_9BACT|nr:hypothetical protein [Runella defluvii]MBB3841760.1 hypothetical protein [Runella defluvii]
MQFLFKSVLLVCVWLSSLLPSFSQALTVSERFVASTPCGSIFQSLLAMPPSAACDFIKWEIIFQRDAQTQAATDFQLRATYGVYQPNTNLFAGGGTPVTITGKWEITKGTKTNPNALVYRLLADQSDKMLSFVKMDDNLLHLLYGDKSLMIGTPSHSYTFNKTVR